MTTAIKQRVTVGPRGTIHLQSDQLRPGDEAEVSVVVEAGRGAAAYPPCTDKGPRETLADYIGTAPPSFKSIEEVDAHTRGLREE